MIFTETKLAERSSSTSSAERTTAASSRGRSASTSSRSTGCKPVIAQANLAFNKYKGTLRGMHFQFPPAAETKLVRCTRGAILDIIVDLRPESPTFLEHVEVELSADNGRALYVPERFAHGYQVLEDHDRDELPGRRVLHAGRRGRAVAVRPRARPQLAAAGHARSPRRTPAGRRSRRSETIKARMAARAAAEAAHDHRRHRAAPARGARAGRSGSR